MPPQLDALVRRTDLVTVGIGANNDRLYAPDGDRVPQVHQICPLYDERDRPRPRSSTSSGPRWSTALRLVQERAPKARVLLIGYPKLLPPARRLRPAAADRGRRTGPPSATSTCACATAMRDAAEEAGVEFVDFYAASLGHDICSAHPWVQGRVGNGRPRRRLHPLAAGQAALARLIEDVLRRPPPD